MKSSAGVTLVVECGVVLSRKIDFVTVEWNELVSM